MLAMPAVWARAYGAGFLDKSEVTDRVVEVVKNFNKVDPVKVRDTSPRAAVAHWGACYLFSLRMLLSFPWPTRRRLCSPTEHPALRSTRGTRVTIDACAIWSDLQHTSGACDVSG